MQNSRNTRKNVDPIAKFFSTDNHIIEFVTDGSCSQHHVVVWKSIVQILEMGCPDCGALWFPGYMDLVRPQPFPFIPFHINYTAIILLFDNIQGGPKVGVQ